MQHARTLMMVALVFLCLGATTAAGRTWTVRKDGTGDFQVIQDAVDAASDGDVIDIGAGRFDDFQQNIDVNNYLWNLYVHILGKSITLKGAGIENTIIGPKNENFHPWPGPLVSLVLGEGCGILKIQDITFEHSPCEMVSYWHNNMKLEVSDCNFRAGDRGVIVQCPSGGIIRDCQFNDLDDMAIHARNPTNNLQVSNCSFTNVYGPAGADWSPSEIHVSDCAMDGGRVGVSFSGGASGSATRCTMRNFENVGVGLNNPGPVIITDNIIDQTDGWGMWLGDANQAEVTNNLIRTQTGCCLSLPYPCDGMIFEGNDLYRGDGDFAQTNTYWNYDPPTYFHLENNYWGTTDPEEIQAHMLDGHVLDLVNMFVIFDPFEGGSVPTQNSSWGSLKAMFRGE